MKKFLLLSILFGLLLFISCNESNNSEKEFLWIKQWGSSGTDIGNSMILDNSGNIYVTGYTDGNLNKNINNGETDIFLTKLNPKGEKQWTKQWGTSNIDTGNYIAIDDNDDIYITGSTGGNFAGNENKGDVDIFLIKFKE